MNRHKLLLVVAALALGTSATGFAGGSTEAPAPSSSPSYMDAVKQWWNGNSGTANWFGLGFPLKDYGLTIEGKAKEVFLGQVTPVAYPSNANGQRKFAIPNDNWSTEVKLNFIYDFGKVFGLNGLTAESDWRYRNVDGSENNGYTSQAAGTSGVFNPNKDTSGMGVRIMSQFLQYSTDPKSKDPRFLLKLGWINPYEDFLTQPESKNFENNAIASAKGIGANAYGYQQGKQKYSVTGVPWSSSYDSWGGMIRAKPSSSTYLQSYLGLAMTGYSGVQSTDNQGYNYNNHGFNFEGAPRFNPQATNAAGQYNYSQNGVYSVNELGWTPKFGEAKLEGRYAIGDYMWGINNNNFGSQSGNTCIWGLYLQGDQRLTAHKTSTPAAPSLSKNPVDSKNPVVPASTSYDKTRGLYSFNEFTYTPAANNTLPFYFQTGLVYKGLFDARPADKFGIAWGEGFYSANQNSQISSTTPDPKGYATKPSKPGQGNGAKYGYVSQNYSTTGVFEFFYDIAINKWLDFVPDAQYIINPTGNGSTVNACILGFTIAAKF